jgi:peptide/nickel transport system substrate-binding protein
VVEDSAGRPLRFTLLSYQGNSVHAQSMVVIQAQLRRIGVDVQLRTLEETTALAMVEGTQGTGDERRRDYDALLTNWETGRSSDDSWFLHSTVRNQPLGITGYANPRADSLMEQLAETLDRNAARPLLREYQRLMISESPVTVVYYPVSPTAVTERLQGVQMVVSSPYASAPRWWVSSGASIPRSSDDSSSGTPTPAPSH